MNEKDYQNRNKNPQEQIEIKATMSILKLAFSRVIIFINPCHIFSNENECAVTYM